MQKTTLKSRKKQRKCFGNLAVGRTSQFFQRCVSLGASYATELLKDEPRLGRSRILPHSGLRCLVSLCGADRRRRGWCQAPANAKPSECFTRSTRTALIKRWNAFRASKR